MPNHSTISTAQYRVELLPSCDLWMRGARFGTVLREYRGRGPGREHMLIVQLDKWPHKVRISSENVTVIQ